MNVRVFFSRLSSLCRNARDEGDLHWELRTHLELLEQENLRRRRSSL